MAVSVVVRGYAKKLYRNTGSDGTPVWDEIATAKDVTINLSKTEEDATSRASGGFEEMVGASKILGFEWEMDERTDTAPAADIAALEDAYHTSEPIQLAGTNIAIAEEEAKGVKAWCEVMTFNRSEPVKGIAKISITAKPTPGESPVSRIAPS